MKLASITAVAALLMAAGAAYAQGTSNPGSATATQEAPASTQAQADASTTPDEDAVVQCRVRRVTGSRTRTNRTCMTRAEWRAFEERQREDVNDMQGSAAGGFQCRTGAQGGCTSN